MLSFNFFCNTFQSFIHSVTTLSTMTVVVFNASTWSTVIVISGRRHLDSSVSKLIMSRTIDKRSINFRGMINSDTRSRKAKKRRDIIDIYTNKKNGSGLLTKPGYPIPNHQFQSTTPIHHFHHTDMREICPTRSPFPLQNPRARGIQRLRDRPRCQKESHLILADCRLASQTGRYIVARRISRIVDPEE